MAENQEQLKPKERQIPVFTVIKNDCILKNIFVLDNPPPISSSSSGEISGQKSEIEEVLLVGRHPDCNIKLEHPSISRFHLRIHSKPDSRSLFVTDLSSIHGTCISGKRIEPGVTMELVPGDTLKLGESSRLYRLDWVPISFAYEVNDPFVPQLDALDIVDEDTQGADQAA
ncbi:FHA domain-containing protein PS1-like [Salvia hispanica]|uniref:FHA domain-containing protein PS1-like n=1 Tax=Salvia hispanica TaxID=49212 RepID=UPI00200932D7|nr:FHA domain-containing protein PS1-like [Salvia hispanica]